MTDSQRILVFNNTRELSKSKYLDATEMMQANTYVVKDEIKGLSTGSYRDISVEPLDTISAILNEASLGVVHIVALNFADALEPGGLVKYGVNTQEECICRCSNLYESLIQKRCLVDYYEYNDKFKHYYSDRLIYSPDVAIFKDSDYNELSKPVYSDIITCPAPVCCSDYNIFLGRIKQILGVVQYEVCQTLVLGAWGCGAFGNNPELVVRAFREALENYNTFGKVVFAIPNKDSENYKVFKRILLED